MGCLVNNFIEAFFIYRLEDVERPHSKYLIVYHCELYSSEQQLKVAVLKVFDDNLNDTDAFYKFDIYTQYTQIANTIIDMELVRVDIALEEYMGVTIAITSFIEFSSSNLFSVYDLTVDSVIGEASFELVEQISAEIVEADTFKVTQLMKIP